MNWESSESYVGILSHTKQVMETNGTEKILYVGSSFGSRVSSGVFKPHVVASIIRSARSMLNRKCSLDRHHRVGLPSAAVSIVIVITLLTFTNALP